MASSDVRPTSLLVLGGARSGKSTFAQNQVEASAAANALEPVYIATAQGHDDEMRSRIARHAAARDARWRTIEAPYGLAEVLLQTSSERRVVLVDCLTLWLSNLILRGDDVGPATDALVAAAGRLPGPVVFVSNEVGSGIVPDNALARRFRDAQGSLNQRFAAACTTVVLVVAGLPMRLKPAVPPAVALR